MIEIVPPEKIKATITLPGSKYIANRVLICAALAKGTTVLTNVPDNDDISAAIGTLKSLGVNITKEDSTLTIEGNQGKFTPQETTLNVNSSGTLMRFITAVTSLIPQKITITGTEQIQKRPIGELLEALSDLGAECNAHNSDCPPVTTNGEKFFGGKTILSGKVSSQYVSALLLIAPYAKGDMTIVIREDLVSKPYVDLTIDMMKRFGVKVEREGYERFTIKAQQCYKAQKYAIPADWSSASYFFAAAALTEGRVRINNLNTHSLQGESHFIDCLDAMGCTLKNGKDWVEVKGPKTLKAIDVDMGAMPDVVQTLAAIAPFAQGTTLIKNVAHLRFKECDRLKGTAQELQKRGVTVEMDESSLKIEGSTINPGVVDSHEDHRMAMSMALLGLRTKGIKINNPHCVEKSFPTFWKVLQQIGVTLHE